MAKSKTLRKATGKASAARQSVTMHEPTRISGADFTAWQGERSNAEVSRVLGIAPNSVAAYREEGAPQSIALACAAVTAGLEPYSSKTAKRAAHIGLLAGALDAMA